MVGSRWANAAAWLSGSVRFGTDSGTAAQVRDKYPERLIERAVRGMLATNRMRDVLLGRLNVYAGAEHPHAAQKPEPLT